MISLRAGPRVVGPRYFCYHMRMSVPCPGCSTQLDLSWTACPVCFRSRTRKEIFGGYSAVQKEKTAKQRRPYKIAALIASMFALTGAGFFLVTRYHVKPADVMRHAQSWRRKAVKAPDYLQSLISTPETPAQPAAIPTPAAVAPKPRAAPAIAPGASQKMGLPPAVIDDRWDIRGNIYELVNLKTAAGLQLNFKSPAGEKISGKTDSKGNFSVKVPRLPEGGYTVSLSFKGRRRNFIEDDHEPSYRQHTRQRREEEAVELLQTGDVLHVPLAPVGSENVLIYNLALLPAR